MLLEVGLVLLDLDHEVVQVDELGADGQAAERRLVQDLVEAVVVLDQLGQSALQQEDREPIHHLLPHTLTMRLCQYLTNKVSHDSQSDREPAAQIQYTTCREGSDTDTSSSHCDRHTCCLLSHLNDAGSIFEVGERPHDVLTHRLHRLFPRTGKPPNQLSDPSCRTQRERERETLNPTAEHN